MDGLICCGVVFGCLFGYAILGGVTGGLHVRIFGMPDLHGESPPYQAVGWIFWPVWLPILVAIFVGKVVCGDIDWSKWFDGKPNNSPAVSLSDRDYDSVLWSGDRPPAPNPEAVEAARRFTEKYK